MVQQEGRVFERQLPLSADSSEGEWARAEAAGNSLLTNGAGGWMDARRLLEIACRPHTFSHSGRLAVRRLNRAAIVASSHAQTSS